MAAFPTWYALYASMLKGVRFTTISQTAEELENTLPRAEHTGQDSEQAMMAAVWPLLWPGRNAVKAMLFTTSLPVEGRNHNRKVAAAFLSALASDLVGKVGRGRMERKKC